MPKSINFSEDIAGRVRNTPLAFSKGLLPLFEAISNAIDAIEDADEQHGKITIRVKREEGTLFRDESERELNAITGFEIEDNGIGFTQGNYESFFTADSMWKMSKGGKGVGRFIWLKAYDNVMVESTYRENGAHYSRKFNFTLTSSRGTAAKPDSIGDGCIENKTIITLLNLKEDYKKSHPITIEQMADRIIEHFLGYFITSTMPKISIADLNGRTIDLNDIFGSEINSQAKTDVYKIHAHQFYITSILLKQTKGKVHELNFCAKKCVVEKYKLKDSINDLPSTISFNNAPSIYYGFIDLIILRNIVIRKGRGLILMKRRTFNFLMNYLAKKSWKPFIQKSDRSFMSTLNQ